MSTSLLDILKYFLIALLWLFFLRVLRAAWLQMSESKRQAESGARAEYDYQSPPTRQNASPSVDVPPRPARPGVSGPAPAPAAARVGQVNSSAVRDPTQLRILESDGQSGRVFDIGEELLMGRSPDCGAALTSDSFVSSRHARAYRDGDGVWAEDLGSTNGTYLNSKPLDKPRRLAVGDRLQVGRTILEAST